MPRLWAVLEGAALTEPASLATAGALASYDSDSPRWAVVEDKVAEALVKVNSIYLGLWLDHLRPIRRRLVGPIAAIFRDSRRPGTDRAQATNILSDYASDDSDLLADFLMDANPEAFGVLFTLVEPPRIPDPIDVRGGDRERPADRSVERRRPQSRVRDDLAVRQARAASALIRLGHPSSGVWPLLRHGADPRLRSFLIDGFQRYGVVPDRLIAELETMRPQIRAGRLPRVRGGWNPSCSTRRPRPVGR